MGPRLALRGSTGDFVEITNGFVSVSSIPVTLPVFDKISPWTSSFLSSLNGAEHSGTSAMVLKCTKVNQFFLDRIPGQFETDIMVSSTKYLDHKPNRKVELVGSCRRPKSLLTF